MSPTTARLLSPVNIISIAILIGSSLFLSWWLIDRSKYVYVSDARVSSTMISLSSRVPGRLVYMPLKEGTLLKEGDVIAKIDAREAEFRLAELDAKLLTLDAEYEKDRYQLELTRQQLSSKSSALQSKLSAAQSSESQAGVELAQAKRELDRANSMLKQHLISEQDYDARKLQLDRTLETVRERRARSGVAVAELALSEVNRSKLLVLEKQLEVVAGKHKALEIEKQRLKNTITEHTIRSPINGVIDETFANLGEYVYPGQRILMLHNPNKTWIKANIKETEIRHLSLGDLVDISIDAYPDDNYQGRIINIANSATSQFALLPSPNPSGNFTKVTQRLEVQIALEQSNPGLNLNLNLKPGMMAELKIRRDSEQKHLLATSD